MVFKAGSRCFALDILGIWFTHSNPPGQISALPAELLLEQQLVCDSARHPIDRIADDHLWATTGDQLAQLA